MTLAHYNDRMRLTCQDTSLNPSTKDKKQPCDAGLYSIYNRNTDCPDAHSATLNSVFIKSINGKLYDFEMEDGTHIKLYQDMEVKVNRNGTEMKIPVPELKNDDDIIEIDYK